MIPLDLQIFEKHPDVDAYRFGPSFTPYAIVAQEKRFTDAELAAEVWRQDVAVKKVEAMGGEPIRTLTALDILHRFATLPHYDEQ